MRQVCQASSFPKDFPKDFPNFPNCCEGRRVECEALARFPTSPKNWAPITWPSGGLFRIMTLHRDFSGEHTDGRTHGSVWPSGQRFSEFPPGYDTRRMILITGGMANIQTDWHTDIVAMIGPCAFSEFLPKMLSQPSVEMLQSWPIIDCCHQTSNHAPPQPLHLNKKLLFMIAHFSRHETYSKCSFHN